MSLINVVLTLIVAGLGLWAINRFIPMDQTVKKILNIVVVVVLCIWLLQGFGIINGFGSIRLN